MYLEHEEVRNRRWLDTERFLDVHQVKFTGFRCPRPIFKFEHCDFPNYIINTIKQDETYLKPTASQCICWPVLLSGRDLIAVTNSSYGKHLAYMLPILVHINSIKQTSRIIESKNAPIVMILTPYNPSKEDIYNSTKTYLDAANVKCFCLYETEEKSDQIEMLKISSFDILIANPIRLLEILNDKSDIVNFENVSFFIVDEYIQFRKTQCMDYVKNIAERLNSNRQTAVFSRLVPSGIQRQGDEFVKNCIFFEMHHDKECANDEIKQIIELIDKNLKISRLIELVDKLTLEYDSKILIYAKDKEKCLTINSELKKHLDLEVIDFRKDESRFATATNEIMTTFKNIGLEIAIPDLQFIINVDFPPNLQTYMDRLRKGVVHYTLFCREDAKHAERLIYSLKQSRQDFDPHLYTMAKAWLECGRDLRFMPMMEDIQIGTSKPLQEIVISSSDEEYANNSGYSSKNPNDGSFSSNLMNDEEDEEDDEEDDDEDEER